MTPSDRRCHRCGRPGGPGKRELRPYGPGGQDVCAGCVFGENGSGPNADALAEATRQLGTRFYHPGTLLLDGSEQVGPRPMTEADDEAL